MHHKHLICARMTLKQLISLQTSMSRLNSRHNKKLWLGAVITWPPSTEPGCAWGRTAKSSYVLATANIVSKAVSAWLHSLLYPQEMGRVDVSTKANLHTEYYQVSGCVTGSLQGFCRTSLMSRPWLPWLTPKHCGQPVSEEKVCIPLATDTYWIETFPSF